MEPPANEPSPAGIPGYRVLHEIGRGGMAVVYLAVQEALDRQVALKVLARALAADGKFAERFLREAQIAASLSHRHIVAIHDFGRHGDQLFLAMEHLPDGSATSLRHGDAVVIAQCMRDMASALAEAHAHGIVHRDLKPENILRRHDGGWVLADFGIARIEHAPDGLTAPNVALGTPEYMSPEQWRGEPVDGRSDLYSLGIVFHELLTGVVPFKGREDWPVGLQHQVAERPRLPARLARWQAILDRLLAVDPAQRYQSAAELSQVLAQVLGAPSQTATPVAPQEAAATSVQSTVPATRARRTNLRAWIGPALLSIAVAVGLVWFWPRGTDSAPSANAARSTQATPAIAILPFTSLSASKDDEYFAEGLSDEILNTLAASPGLRVAGRTSAFSFKGQRQDLREIGRKLGVDYLLEGSVRREGSTVLITAQLVRADTGFRAWSQSYERKSGKLLMVQNDIARAVGDTLHVVLTQMPHWQLNDEASATQYLTSLGQLGGATEKGLLAGRDQLEVLMQKEPQFLPAYPRLAITYIRLTWFNLMPVDVAIAKIQALARSAESVSPGSIEARIASAFGQSLYADYHPTRRAYQQVLHQLQGLIAESPNRPELLALAAETARVLGDDETALSLIDRAIALEPLDTEYLATRTGALHALGRRQDVIAQYEQRIRQTPGLIDAYAPLAWGDTAESRFEAALRRGLQCADAGGLCAPIFYRLYDILRADDLRDRSEREVAISAELAENFKLRAVVRDASYDELVRYLDQRDPMRQQQWVWTSKWVALRALDEGRDQDAYDLVARFNPELLQPDPPAPLFDRAIDAMVFAIALERLGQHERSQKLLVQLFEAFDHRIDRSYPPEADLDLGVLAHLGRNDEAVERLQRRIQQGWSRERELLKLGGDQPSLIYAPLFNDPRVPRLLKGVREANAKALAKLKSSGLPLLPPSQKDDTGG